MKVIIILSLFALALCGTRTESVFADIHDLFVSWKQVHNKEYNSVEDQVRFNIFTKNYFDIVDFNSQDDDVVLALNQFADLTNEEFSALNAGCYKQKMTGFPGAAPAVESRTIGDLPASVDWRTEGAVTPIKNQGQCGSCWTFSTTGSLEGLNFLNSSTLLSFSEQQLVDCVTADQGCDGGDYTDAFAYTAQNGIELESDYPYTGEDGTCAYDSSKAHKVNKNYVNVNANSTDDLKAAIVGQPTSVAVDASGLQWQFYAGGVVKRLCGAALDHAVLAVGYKVINGNEAFIVKNSWGAGWGNAGYIYIATDGTANSGAGVCGILSGPPAVPTN